MALAQDRRPGIKSWIGISKLWKVRRCVNLEPWRIETVMVGSNVSVATVIAGTVAYLNIPVAALPSFNTPVISVSA